MQIFAAFFLLVIELLMLSLQPLQTQHIASGPAKAVQAHGMTASVELGEHMITLRLKGHPRGVEPKLAVKAGSTDMSSLLRDWESNGTETSVRISNAGANLYPARLITYTWEAGDRQVTGEHLYANPGFPFTWKREQRGPFIIYHSGTLSEELTDKWVRIYSTMAGMLGPEPPEQTIYLLPDEKALNDSVKGRDAAGAWIEELDALFLSSDKLVLEVVTHELAHALLVNDQPSFWEEGVAVWLAGQTLRRHELYDGSLGYQVRFRALQKVMETEGTFLMQANNRSKSPRDPYTVGFSFLLYVQDRFGAEKLTRAVVLAEKRPLGEALETALGENLGQLEEGWREFVKTGGHLKMLSNQ